MNKCLIWFCPLFIAAAVFSQVDTKGKSQSPFESATRVRILLFVRTDCPITNRYAPELKRIAAEFQNESVKFWLIYPDKVETPAAVEKHQASYQLPGVALLDFKNLLVKRAQATVSPQAAVFNQSGKLLYSGRIDNRYLDFGKSRNEPTTHDLEAAIRATLEGKPVSQPRTKAVGCYLSDLQ